MKSCSHHSEILLKRILLKRNEPFIVILGGSQLLKLYHKKTVKTFHISTAKNGFGETLNSFKTPRGWHYIRAIIGKGNPTNCHYLGRRALKPSDSSLISARILWLCGMEPHNHKASSHSMRRYIYIHGSPIQFKKTPISSGCINMRNIDIVELTEHIQPYCKVLIEPE